MLECYNNTQELAVAMAAEKSKEEADEQVKQIKAAEPDKEFVEIVRHFEKEYNCSGLCGAPLFYFTQSIKNGPPKDACLLPAMNDISSALQNLGAMLILTGILFFAMIPISIPICCYNKEKEVTEEDEDEQAKKAAEEAEKEGRDANYKVAETGSQKMGPNQMA